MPSRRLGWTGNDQRARNPRLDNPLVVAENERAAAQNADGVVTNYQ